MTDLNDIWKNVKTSADVKTLWFDTPEEATEYLGILIKNLSDKIQIANEEDEEISIDELILVFNDYRKSQETNLYFRLVENVTNYITVNLECWSLQNDCDCYADVLTISNYKTIEEEKFIVRLYDGFDNVWIDVSKPLSKEEAKEVWNQYTIDGTKNTCFDDID